MSISRSLAAIPSGVNHQSQSTSKDALRSSSVIFRTSFEDGNYRQEWEPNKANYLGMPEDEIRNRVGDM